MSNIDVENRVVEAGGAGKRLDRFLAAAFPEHSRSRLKALVLAGAVRINEHLTFDPAAKLKVGDAVSLDVPPPAEAVPQPQDIPLDIVYEDDQLIVIDKPAGLVVHPAAGHESGTLVNALLHHCRGSLSGINGVLRPGIVHRLDKDTSGLMVAAKTDVAHRSLAAQFADHGRTGSLERAYLALCWGVPLRPQGTIDAPIARSTSNREKMAVLSIRPILKSGEPDPDAGSRGRFAITHYQVEGRFTDTDGQPVACLVRCLLETGRTHQIRVHMAHIGHPLLGDTVYGAGFRTKAGRLAAAAQEALTALDRQALHATVLGFEHPVSGETMLFERDPPADFQSLADALHG